MGKTKDVKTAAPTPAQPTVPLEQLAREQGVTPITDLDALGALWPEGDDPDEFDAWLTAERAARRRLVKE